MRNALLIGLMATIAGAPLPAGLHAQGRAAPAERRLDQPDASHPEPFSLLTGVRELPDGRVLVSDGIDQTLMSLNMATGRTEALGRTGQGPGEYRSPDALFPMPEGATLLMDLGNGRLSLYGADGRYRESIPIAQGTPGPGAGPGGLRLILPRAVDGRGRLYFQQPGGPMPGGVPADSQAVLRFDRSSGGVDTVAFIKVAPPAIRTTGSANNQNVRMMPRPFPASDGWAVAPDGRLAIVRAADYRVEWVTPTGRLRGQPVVARPVPIRDAERREWAASVGGGLSISMENRNGEITTNFRRGRPGAQEPDLSGVEWPRQKPAFVSANVFATPEGDVWVERSVAAGAPRQYDVFDRQGTLTSRVIFQPDRRVVAFGNGTVYVVRSDEDDLQYLERYRR
ncbi:MAG TPA: hypothetical protein VMK53_09440 [Gemmatimonadales bacterium]|nr:hypothetical protein [Gemmatimonadales bacterium]